jgi:hypothetical protein
MGGWMGGRESGVKDCLQQSKIKVKKFLNDIFQCYELWINNKFCVLPKRPFLSSLNGIPFLDFREGGLTIKFKNCIHIF